MSLDRSRDLELRGRGHHTLLRRVGLGVLALIALAALLGLFGQETTSTVATSRRAVLSVDAPSRLRGGLLFQARFEIQAKRRIDHPKLFLSRGWVDSMTLNSLIPQPFDESSNADGITMSFEPLAAGSTLSVWTDWQVNPTNVGRHSEDVTLYDGATPITTADRTVTVFP